MKRYILLGLLLLVGFTGAGSAVADTAVSAEGSGACNYDGSTAEDSSSATVGDDGSASSDEPDSATVQDALDNCIAAASNGDTPEGGSHLDLTVTVVEGDNGGSATSAFATTTPLAQLATGGEEGVQNSAAAEGACNPNDGGASDEGSASAGTDDQGASGPAAENVQQAATSCATSGETPKGGSSLAGDVSLANGAVSAGFDTVPVSQNAP
jgi:hypothetical protein